MIDLHAHTTASDGRSTPRELVQRARTVGITTIAVTDHDTMASVPETAALAASAGMGFVPGIEITSVSRGKDAHVLGYFLSPDAPGLGTVTDQRRRRVERAREIGRRLEQMGAPIDVDALLASAGERSGKAIARPQIAQALIAAGHVATVAEAFDRFLGENCAAYMPHTGAPPADVVRLIAAGGGIASLAHPGHLKQDDVIPELVDAGMAALEVYHSSHDEAATAHYLQIAKRLSLAVTGGSDYHGEGVRRAEFFGVVHLPEDEYLGFLKRAGRERGQLPAVHA